MNAEAGGAFGLCFSVCLYDLLMADTIFCFKGIANDIIACTSGSRVIAKTNQFRNVRYLVQQADIIKIKNTTILLSSFKESLLTGVVGGKHNIICAPANCPAEL